MEVPYLCDDPLFAFQKNQPANPAHAMAAAIIPSTVAEANGFGDDVPSCLFSSMIAGATDVAGAADGTTRTSGVEVAAVMGGTMVVGVWVVGVVGNG